MRRACLIGIPVQQCETSCMNCSGQKCAVIGEDLDDHRDGCPWVKMGEDGMFEGLTKQLLGLTLHRSRQACKRSHYYLQSGSIRLFARALRRTGAVDARQTLGQTVPSVRIHLLAQRSRFGRERP